MSNIVKLPTAPRRADGSLSVGVFYRVYPGDDAIDCAGMSPAEYGAFCRLRNQYHRQEGPLPDDNTILTRYTGMTPAEWKKARPAVQAKFDVGEGTWRNTLFDERLAEAREKSEQARSAAEKRHGKGKATVVPFAGAPGDADASASAVPVRSHRHSHTESEGREGAPAADFTFQGEVIQLRQEDLDLWRKTYHAIPDLEGELLSIDAWLVEQSPETQARWHKKTVTCLNRAHQEEIRKRQRAEEEETMGSFL